MPDNQLFIVVTGIYFFFGKNKEFFNNLLLKGLIEIVQFSIYILSEGLIFRGKLLKPHRSILFKRAKSYLP